MQRDIYQESQTTEFYWIEGKFLSQNIPAAYQISLIKKKKFPGSQSPYQVQRSKRKTGISCVSHWKHAWVCVRGPERVITKLSSQPSVCAGSTALVQDWQSFLVKGQRVNIFGFAGHMLSVSNTQLRLCNARQLQAVLNTRVGLAL